MNNHLPLRRDFIGTMAAASVLVLAFLLAATPVRNSDYWLHLASGKALVQGHWEVDPFSYTAADSDEVNHSWLYDLLMYGLFQVLGNPGLALAKSFFVAGLAFALLAWGRTGCHGLLWPSLGTALTLMALGPWLAFKPVGISLLCLVLTQLLLDRVHAEAGVGRIRWWLWACPLFLFVLWANLDRWFVLGPVLALLHYAAAFVPLPRPRRTPGGAAGSSSKAADKKRAARRLLGLILLGSAAACLISPYGAGNLRLPTEFFQGKTAEALSQDAYLRQVLYAPSGNVYSLATCWNQPAGVIYWLLVILTVVSFGADCRRWHASRVLTVGIFLGLSWWLSPGVAFLALMAGPIFAMNLQDRLSGQAIQPVPSAAVATRPRWAGLLPSPGWVPRLSGAVLPVAVAPLVWTGLLHSGALGARAWGINMDPSLERAAQQIARWREEGKLAHGTHGLNLSLEPADILAWLCPRERSFVTSHLAASMDVWQDLVSLRTALRSPETPAPAGWRSILRRRNIDFVVLYGPDVHAALRKILSHPEEWPLLYVGGSVVIVGWRDPQSSTDPFQGWELDLNNVAFGGQADAFLPPQVEDRAPAAPWWLLLETPPARNTFCHEQAAVFLDSVLLTKKVQARYNLFLSHPMALAGWIGSSAASLAPALSGPEALYRLPLLSAVLDDARPAVLYLAVRSARRATQEVSDNAQGYFCLGTAYHSLLHDTRERLWGRGWPLLQQLRQEQAAVGLVQGARLAPDFPEAHDHLADLCFVRGQFDLALAHLLRAREALQRQGPTDVLPQIFGARMLGLNRRISVLSEAVEERHKEYDRSTVGMPVPARARRAAALGLASEALKLLAQEQDLPPDLLHLKFTLLLTDGRLAEARACLGAKEIRKLSVLATGMMTVRLAAVSGDYEVADRCLGELTAGEKSGTLSEPEQATARVLRGLLLIEDGKPATARGIFRQALGFWNTPTGQLLLQSSDQARTAWHVANHYLTILDEHLEPQP